MMVGEMTAYLGSEILFWPSTYAGLTTVTLGNYLMCQNRLLALRSSALNALAQDRLDVTVARFDRLLYYNTEKFKQKISCELEARLRQWREYVQQLAREESKANCYETEVENRVIIEDIFQKLSILTCYPESYIAEEIEQLDLNLRQCWQPGKFIWPVEWQPAYPQAIYWWLYGQSQSRVKVRVNMSERSPYVPQPRLRPSVGLSLATEIGGV
ncbi:MAG: hypothetical protein KJ077_18675 [Anaerolineae bacterium]|nr:hypothetical protein [Anaerolineae bacterium]